MPGPVESGTTSQFQRYLLNKTLWFGFAFFVAIAANFFLPRLIPGNPVDVIVARLSAGGTEARALQRVHETYVKEFKLNDPAWEQFASYLRGLASGDLGTSFSRYPAPVSGLIAEALPWTIALQIPAILIGWMIGNVLGATAAYRGGWFDRGAFTSSLVFSAVPYYCLAIILLYVFAVHFRVFPAAAGLLVQPLPGMDC